MENKLSRWAKYTEFSGEGKTIVPVAIKKLCPPETDTMNPKFLDKEGCTLRLVFKDMDNGEVERWYENSFPSFKWAITNQKVEKNKEYQVSLNKEHEGKWKWQFTKL